ncbi:MAG: DUF4367 domain-containing protein [Clostridia bacterium]|jgi:hypothetical protein|nr:DUF4367 domain-containing protein [Clostridia bacterium]
MNKENHSRQIEELLKTDFSRESDSQEKILNQILNKLENSRNIIEDKKESLPMKKIFVKPIFTAAMVVVLITGFVTTSFGQDLWRIIKEISVGKHAKYTVIERTGTPDLTIPEELKGKLYDKSGNVLAYFPENGAIYNQRGEEVLISVVVYENEDGSVVTKIEALSKEEQAARETSQMTTLTDPESAKPYLAFDFSLPAYLPEGYAFDRIQLFNDENGQPVENCEYASVYFSNGDQAKDIYLQLRLMNEETAYEADIGNVDEVEINGHKGIIGESNLDIEIDGVMYMFMAGASGINNEQLFKMAESIR